MDAVSLRGCLHPLVERRRKMNVKKSFCYSYYLPGGNAGELETGKGVRKHHSLMKSCNVFDRIAICQGDNVVVEVYRSYREYLLCTLNLCQLVEGWSPQICIQEWIVMVVAGVIRNILRLDKCLILPKELIEVLDSFICRMLE